MTTTPKVLIAQQNIPATVTTAYTSPVGGKGTWVDQMDVCNYTSTAATIRVWVVPVGGTAVDSAIRVIDKSIASKATVSLDEVVGSFLNPGDFIAWQAGTATAVNGGASGRELS